MGFVRSQLPHGNKAQHIQWNKSANQGFEKVFSTATLHMWKYLDLSKSFARETDASETRVRTVLYQRLGDKAKQHPVAVFSKKKTPVGRNHDASNMKLLAVKLVMEE